MTQSELDAAARECVDRALDCDSLNLAGLRMWRGFCGIPAPELEPVEFTAEDFSFLRSCGIRP
jgi:hypothetical protein